MRRGGCTDVAEYRDTVSGAKFSRAGLDALMREVRKGRIDAIVAYKLDRLGRSLAHLAQLIGEMTAHLVALVIPAQGIDTSASNPASQLQLNILMAVAEFEREIIRERVQFWLACSNGTRRSFRQTGNVDEAFAARARVVKRGQKHFSDRSRVDAAIQQRA